MIEAAAAVIGRNNVTISGRADGPVMMFAHGFGCDQAMWRKLLPYFADDYRLVLFDHVGAGHSDISAYDWEKYGSLNGYASDLLEICAAGHCPHVSAPEETSQEIRRYLDTRS